MNRRNFLDAGDIVYCKFITSKQLDRVYTSPKQELTRILRTFSYRDILVNLSRINLLFHRSTNFDVKDIKAYNIPLLDV